jgi:hypothetical protein
MEKKIFVVSTVPIDQQTENGVYDIFHVSEFMICAISDQAKLREAIPDACKEIAKLVSESSSIMRRGIFGTLIDLFFGHRGSLCVVIYLNGMETNSADFDEIGINFFKHLSADLKVRKSQCRFYLTGGISQGKDTNEIIFICDRLVASAMDQIRDMEKNFQLIEVQWIEFLKRIGSDYLALFFISCFGAFVIGFSAKLGENCSEHVQKLMPNAGWLFFMISVIYIMLNSIRSKVSSYRITRPVFDKKAKGAEHGLKNE